MAARYCWNRSSLRVQDASSVNAVNEVCDTSSWKVEMLLVASSRWWTSAPWLTWIQSRNPFQARLIIASYTILWSLTARLYLRHAITQVMDPSAITPDFTHMSCRPTSWNLFPMVDRRFQMVWNAPILSVMFLNLKTKWQFSVGQIVSQLVDNYGKLYRVVHKYNFFI